MDRQVPLPSSQPDNVMSTLDNDYGAEKPPYTKATYGCVLKKKKIRGFLLKIIV